MNELNSKQTEKTADFDFQKWPVYQKAIQNVRTSYDICESLPRDSATGIRDQMRRAAHSIPLNIAEACSRTSKKDKANFWRIAKGSTFECVAILDTIRVLGLEKRDFTSVYKELAAIGRMLSGLIRYIERED